MGQSSKSTRQTFINGLDTFSLALGKLSAWAALALIILQFTIVLLRYVFGIGPIILQEAVIYLHVMVFVLAVGMVMKADGHVRVDVVYSQLSEKARRLIDIAGTLLLLLPFSLMLIWTAFPFVSASWAVYEGSSETGGIPGIFILKSMILVYAGLIFLQGFALLARHSLGQGPSHNDGAQRPDRQ